jgi:hypothetical protein
MGGTSRPWRGVAESPRRRICTDSEGLWVGRSGPRIPSPEAKGHLWKRERLRLLRRRLRENLCWRLAGPCGPTPSREKPPRRTERALWWRKRAPRTGVFRMAGDFVCVVPVRGSILKARDPSAWGRKALVCWGESVVCRRNAAARGTAVGRGGQQPESFAESSGTPEAAARIMRRTCSHRAFWVSTASDSRLVASAATGTLRPAAARASAS